MATLDGRPLDALVVDVVLAMMLSGRARVCGDEVSTQEIPVQRSEHAVPPADHPVAVAVFEGVGRVVTFASPGFRRWLRGGLRTGMSAGEALRRVDGRRFQATLDQVWTTAAPQRHTESVRGLLGPAAGEADDDTAFAVSWSPITDDEGVVQSVLFVAVELPDGPGSEPAVAEQVDAHQLTRENLLLRLATAAMQVSSSRDKLSALA